MEGDKELAKQAGKEAKNATKIRVKNMLTRALKCIEDGMEADIIKVFCYEGEVIESDPYTDHATRLKAADMALTLNDAYPAKKHEVEVTGNLADRIKDARERAKNRS